MKMMSEMVRRPSEQMSPKNTSPRGNRSPVVVPRQDSTGTLKTTISLGKTPTIVNSGPFYLMKELPPPSRLTGATNLLQHHYLEHSFNRYCGRKIKDQLSAFLPNLPGDIDVSVSKEREKNLEKDREKDMGNDSSLRRLIERPPITSIEIQPLSKQQLDAAFRLHVGPVPEQYNFMTQTVGPRKKLKHKKSKIKGSAIGVGVGSDSPNGIHIPDGSHHHHQMDNNERDLITTISSSQRDIHEKKHKKQKRHDEEKERKKKKKDKKKKKRHSPDSPPGYDTPSIAGLDDHTHSPMMSSGSLLGTPGTPLGGTNHLQANNGLVGSLVGNTGSVNSGGSGANQLAQQSSSLLVGPSQNASLNGLNGSSSGGSRLL